MANFWLQLKKEREAKTRLAEMMKSLCAPKSTTKKKQLWLPPGIKP